MHLSESQLRRVFTSSHGIPPSVYLSRARARRMAEILRARPDTTIHEAARQAGWRSRTHATAAFAQAYGITPAAYRAGANQGCELDNMDLLFELK